MPPKPAPPRAEVRRPRPFTLGTGVAAVVLAVLTVLFFHELMLGGRTFVGPDATEPLGFVRVGEQSLWQDKVYPLWNPLVFLGLPSFGSGAYNPLIYPPDWPLALLGRVVPLPDMIWMILYYFLGGLFMFCLAREWGARAEGALIAGAAFVFQPNLVAVGSHGHGSQLVDSAYLPLLVWMASRWLRTGQLSALGWLALAGGFQLLRGHVQVCFYTWIAVALLTVLHLLAGIRRPAELRTRLVRGLGIAAAVGLAFGLAGFFNLPLRDYAQYSIRGGGEGGGAGLAYATQWSMAPYELLAAVVPEWVGFGGATYWGGMPFTDYPNAFLGIIAVLLLVPVFVAGGRVPLLGRVFAAALAVLALLVSFGSYGPVYRFLYDHLPLFNRFRIPVMIVILLQLAAGLGAAWGWSAVLDRGPQGDKGDSRLPRLWLALAAVSGVLLLMGLAGGEGFRSGYVAMALASKPGFSPEAANAAFAGFASDLPKVGFLALALSLLAWATSRGKVQPLAASIGVLALLLFELWPISARIMQPVIGDPVVRSEDHGRDDVVRFLEQQGSMGTFRVFEPERFTSNRLATFKLAQIHGYHPAKPRLFQDLIESQALSDTRWLALLDVRFIVLSQPLQSVPPFLREVHRSTAVVYENLAVLPRATLVGEYGVVPDTGRAAIDSVMASGRDPSRWTWLTRDPGIPSATLTGGSAEVQRYTLHEVAVKVSTPQPALLRLADLWYPDWRVTVDGSAAVLLRADHALRAVAVPAGEHEVVFRFESPAIRQGLMLSIASAVLVLLLIAAGWWQGRRPTAEAGGA